MFHSLNPVSDQESSRQVEEEPRLTIIYRPTPAWTPFEVMDLCLHLKQVVYTAQGERLRRLGALVIGGVHSKEEIQKHLSRPTEFSLVHVAHVPFSLPG